MAPKRPVYLDYHATTPCDPLVVEEMLRFLGVDSHFGNASSRTHAFGWAAEKGVDIARERLAACIGATPRELLFTSGATEANNLAIKGAALAYAEKGRPLRKGRGGAKGKHIITQAIEHKAVLDSCKWLETMGYDVTVLDVDENGHVEPNAWPTPSVTRPSSFQSCSQTMRSAPYSPSKRSVKYVTKMMCCSTVTPCRA